MRLNLFKDNGNIIGTAISLRGRSRAPNESFDDIDDDLRQRIAAADKTRGMT